MSRRLTPEDDDAFVRMMENGADVTLAAKQLGVSRNAFYARMAKNAKLRERVQGARRTADERVVANLYRIATRTKRVVPRCNAHGPDHHPAAVCSECHQAVVVEVADADVNAIKFWLTNRQKDEWKLRWTVENVVQHDAVVAFVAEVSKAIQEFVSDEEARRRLAAAIESAGAHLESGPTVH